MNGLPNGVNDSSDENESANPNQQNTAMYVVKRPYDIPSDVQLPETMYKVTPINPQTEVSDSSHDVVTGSTSRGTLTTVKTTSEATTAGSSSSGVPPEAMDVLEKRQVKIIEQLRSLREIISNIHVKCVETGCPSSVSVAAGISKSSVVIGSSSEKQLLPDENIDIVIHANPSRPPYSLLFFVNLLEHNYSNAVVSVTSHTHSTYKGVVDERTIDMFDQEKENANFKFTMIWKKVAHCTMIVTPVQSTYIYRESNIARFLSRLLPVSSDSLNYDCLNWDTLVKVDFLLEKAESHNIATFIEKELKNTKNTTWLLGRPTIADLVLYSSVTSKLFNGQKNIPKVVGDWVKSVIGFYNNLSAQTRK